jgi:hypothetical protein
MLKVCPKLGRRKAHTFLRHPEEEARNHRDKARRERATCVEALHQRADVKQLREKQRTAQARRKFSALPRFIGRKKPVGQENDKTNCPNAFKWNWFNGELEFPVGIIDDTTLCGRSQAVLRQLNGYLPPVSMRRESGPFHGLEPFLQMEKGQPEAFHFD